MNSLNWTSCLLGPSCPPGHKEHIDWYWLIRLSYKLEHVEIITLWAHKKPDLRHLWHQDWWWYRGVTCNVGHQINLRQKKNDICWWGGETAVISHSDHLHICPGWLCRLTLVSECPTWRLSRLSIIIAHHAALLRRSLNACYLMMCGEWICAIRHDQLRLPESASLLSKIIYSTMPSASDVEMCSVWSCGMRQKLRCSPDQVRSDCQGDDEDEGDDWQHNAPVSQADTPYTVLAQICHQYTYRVDKAWGHHCVLTPDSHVSFECRFKNASAELEVLLSKAHHPSLVIYSTTDHTSYGARSTAQHSTAQQWHNTAPRIMAKANNLTSKQQKQDSQLC